MVIKNGDTHQFIPSDILDDLCSRFLINLPHEERTDVIRICYHVEMAHWFYLDNYCSMYNLRPCGLKKFAAHIFQHIPYHEHFNNLDTLLANWNNYKQRIPTYGAILLDEDLSHVLLVQPFLAKIHWGYPKGKINEDEEPWACAAREVLEETGFDISKRLNKMEYIESTVKKKTIRLYIIPNVPHDTIFKPRTKNEIKCCRWFRIVDFPPNKKAMTLIAKKSHSHNSFKMVMPFINKIRRWVSERKLNESTSVSRQHSISSDECFTTTTEIGISHELQNADRNYQDENFATQELQDAFRKYQQKNYPTLPQSDFMQYQHQDFSSQELQIAYMKYLKHTQPCGKLLNMGTKNEKQHLTYYKYQDGQLQQIPNAPMTPNNGHVWSTTTSANNLSNLEKYYQQELPTQQLKNALMISKQQNSPCFEYQESQLYQKQSSPNNSCGWSKNTSENNLSNLEEYYQQELSTEQLMNVLIMYEQQNSPFFEYQESQLYQKQEFTK